MALALSLVAGCAHPEQAQRAGATASTSAAPLGRLEMQSLPQLLQRAEASPKKFGISTAPASEFRPRVVATAFWPQARQQIPGATVLTDGDRRAVVAARIDARANALLTEAEPAYQVGRYAEAAKLAEKATELDPNSHFAWLYRGDCAYFSGDAETALKHYDRALALNDADYQVHFYRGNALFRLGRKEEARESFARALAAKPRHETLVDRILGDETLEFTVRPDLIDPKVKVTATADGADIVVAKDRMEWLGYGVCKALWLVDDEYRQARGGGADHGFSTTEELECLGALLDGYQSLLDRKETTPDPNLDYLVAVAQAGDASKLVLYELASRVDPQVSLMMPPAVRAGLVDYIQKHVFMRRPPLPKDRPRGGQGQLHGSLLLPNG